MNNPGPIIQARELAIGFDGTPFLSGIGLEIHTGSVVGIIGPNGAGKSTLLKTLAGIIPPQNGSVTRKEGCTVGYVPQHQVMDSVFPLSALEVTLQGRQGKGRTLSRAQAKKKALGHLEKLGFTDMHMPFQALSGGQRQRVLIARAMLREPTLLLLDEPTAGLDPPSRSALLTQLGEIGHCGNLAIVLIAHHLHMIERFVDQVVLMNRFTDHFESGPVSILNSDALDRLYGTPLNREVDA